MVHEGLVGRTDTTAPRSPRYIIPALGHIHERTKIYAWPLIRFFAGIMLVPHGAQKLFGAFGGGGLSGTAAYLQKMGLEPAMPLAVLAGCAEFFGGLLVAIGLLTRPAALAGFILMAVAVLQVHLPNGFFATQGGYEYPLLWGIVLLAIVLRGGGHLSVDRALGREF